MPKFSANVSMLFTEVPLLERFAAAARAGFQAVEIQFPYECGVDDLRERLVENALELVLHNLPAGNWAKGDRGIACLPERQAEFRAGVELGVRYAAALRCSRLNCLAGIAGEATRARDTLIENLRYAARVCADAGISLLIEPLNTLDVPGFFLNRSAQALEIIDAVGAPNVLLQFDAYHLQIMEGDLARTLERHLGRIGHIQIADTPGRHEPGTGEIDFDVLLRTLDELRYSGWVGCEYRPRTNTLEGLGWLQRFRQRASS
jgi:hydroxypyruvate isomerase